jgi:hypothetical protein
MIFLSLTLREIMSTDGKAKRIKLVFLEKILIVFPSSKDMKRRQSYGTSP